MTRSYLSENGLCDRNKNYSEGRGRRSAAGGQCCRLAAAVAGSGAALPASDWSQRGGRGGCPESP